MSDNATLTPLAESLKQSKEKIAQRDFPAALDILTRARKEQFEGATAAEKEDLAYSFGVCFNGVERPAEAITHLSRSLQLAEQGQDVGGQARTMEELGSAHHQRGDYRQALFCYERALELFEKTEDKAGIARGHRNCGGAKVDLGHATAAVEEYKTARKLFSELGDTEGVATCVTNQALLVFRYQGRQATIAAYQEELKAGDCSHFLVYNNLGFLELLEEKTADSRANLLKGVEDCKTRNVQDDNIGLLYLNLGILDTLEGKFDEAEEYYKQAGQVFTNYPLGRAVEVVLLPKEVFTTYEKEGLSRFFTTDDGHKMAVTFLNSAMNAWEQGKKDQALELCQQAAAMDKEMAYPLLALGWLHRLRGEDNLALAAFKRAVAKEPRNEMFKKSLDLLNPYAGAKVGRNDACPCGSGKKFKKCHGAS